VSGGQAGAKTHWIERRPDGSVTCLLCPHACLIRPDGRGVCGVRTNRGGEISLPYYGRVSALAVDPIEKKPLYHFHPGSRILSAGFVGCNLRCRFCQNWRISQSTDAETRFMSPAELVAAAQAERSFAIAYTYSEPLVHLEYVLEAAGLARAAGLKNVLVTNGYVNEEPARAAIDAVDAANVDLKAYTEGFYKVETGGSLEEVKRFIRLAAGRIHLEVTTLVIPSKNDSVEQIEGIARFLEAIDPGIPLHLSAYHPDYRYDIPPTPPATVRALAEVARRRLRHVYTGNLGTEPSDTLCAGCGAVLVRRRGYAVSLIGVREGVCASCGRPAPIIGLSPA
jgi:pyruvate formate lyase activating enzyme